MRWVFIVSVFFAGCSGLEKSEQENIRRVNEKGEYILRHHDEQFYKIEPAKKREIEPYSWEK